MSMIEVSKINKTFKTQGREVRALRDITLNVEEGDFFALIGLNGAGKTTLIRILTGVLLPDTGNVTLCGANYNKNESELKKKIGVVMGGEHSLYGKLTATENLKFFAAFYDITKSQLNIRLPKIFKLLGLENKKDHLVETYSKGMKQKLLIAKALIHNPDILILDEPCNGIDVVTNLEIKKLLKRLNEKEKKTIILTTHNLYDAEDLCDKLCILQEGKIIAKGAFEEIYKTYFKDKVIHMGLKKPLAELSKENILKEKHIKKVVEESHEGSFKYKVILDSEEVDLSCILKHIETSHILSIEEKKVTLEFLLKYLVEKNEAVI